MVSLFSVIISFYTFKLQRTHNIKSVTPIIHIGQWDYENRLFVTMANVGAGLAMIKRMMVHSAKGETKSCIYDWLPQQLPGKMNYKEYWTPYTEFVVQAGQVIKLIEIPCDTNVKEQVEMREKLRRIIGQLTVEVIYEDIYTNKQPDKKMQLSHFLRLDNENSVSQIEDKYDLNKIGGLMDQDITITGISLLKEGVKLPLAIDIAVREGHVKLEAGINFKPDENNIPGHSGEVHPPAEK